MSFFDLYMPNINIDAAADLVRNTPYLIGRTVQQRAGGTKRKSNGGHRNAAEKHSGIGGKPC